MHVYKKRNYVHIQIIFLHHLYMYVYVYIKIYTVCMHISYILPKNLKFKREVGIDYIIILKVGN